MTQSTRRARTAAIVLGALSIAASPGAAQQAPAERVAALKEALAVSQKQLRQYEWIETTIVSLKGEERSRVQHRCYYGADGALQKIPITSADQPSAPESGRRGGRLRQAIVENKKEELQDYMERAVSLVHQYVPPTPDRIEVSRASGRMVIRPGVGNGPVGLDFNDYLKNGDRLSVQVGPADNRLVALGVASYLDEPDDAVTLDVRFGTLADGTIYAAQSTLDARAKNVRVVVQNSGYRPLAR